MATTPTPTKKTFAGINRRSFLKTSLLAGAALTMPRQVFSIGTSRSKKPNVLFIAVDDLRPQLGCYGFNYMQTPFMDELGASGCVFERAYCQQAVCSPSRTSLMTGLRPDDTKIYDLRTHFRDTIPDAVTLPQYFKQNGYHSQAYGKIYHGPLDDAASWSVPWHPSGPRVRTDRPQSGNYVTPEGIAAHQQAKAEWEAGGRKGMIFGLPYEIQDIDDDEHGDGALSLAAEQTLAQLAENPEEPFFLGVGYRKPHLAFLAPKKYWDLYPEDSIDLDDNPFRPKGAPDIALTEWGELRAYATVPKEGPLSEEMARNLIRGYYACTSFIDAQVGRLMAALKKHDMWENTVICLWGDHGFHLGDKGLWCKHTNYETAVHSPLLMRDPNSSGGKKTRGLCEFVDVYPTLCDLADLEIPTNLAGISLAEPIARDKQTIKEAAFSQYPRGNIMGYSMRTDRYRFTTWENQNTGNQTAMELYDHENDPNEMVNIAEQADSQPVVSELTTLLNRMSPEVFSARKITAS